MHDEEIPSFEERTEATFEGRRRVRPTLIGLVAIAAIAIVFIIGNRRQAEIRLLIPTVHTSVWVAIVASIVLGVILDRLLLAWWRRRHRER